MLDVVKSADDTDESCPKQNLPLTTAAASGHQAQTDATSLQSNLLLDGVELNRIAGSSAVSPDSRTCHSLTKKTSATDASDVTLLDPVAAAEAAATIDFSSSSSSLDLDCGDDVPLLVPEDKSFVRNAPTVNSGN